MPTAYVNPFTIIVDTREQLPYTFENLHTDKKDGQKLIFVKTERATLGTGYGDYSIKEFNRIAIERKSDADLYQSISQNRENFEKRLELMSSRWSSHIVVEAEISTLLMSPPRFTKYPSKSLYRTLLAWRVRFPHIQWHFLPNRSVAEATTFRLLERFWTEYHDWIPEVEEKEAQGTIINRPEYVRKGFSPAPPQPRKSSKKHTDQSEFIV